MLVPLVGTRRDAAHAQRRWGDHPRRPAGTVGRPCRLRLATPPSPPSGRAAAGWSTRGGHPPPFLHRPVRGSAVRKNHRGSSQRNKTCCRTIHGAVCPRRVAREGGSTPPRSNPPTRRARPHLRAHVWARSQLPLGEGATPRLHALPPTPLPHTRGAHPLPSLPTSAALSAPHPSAVPLHVDPPPSTKTATPELSWALRSC